MKTTTKNPPATRIILIPVVSAPVFDFLASPIIIGLGIIPPMICGGMLFSPLLAVLVGLVTGFLGGVIGKSYVNNIDEVEIRKSRIFFIGAACGFVAGIIAARIWAFTAC